jgi:hypothetical protein
MQKLLELIPQAALYPIGWCMAATEWIEAHPNWTFVLWVLTGVLGVVF